MFLFLVVRQTWTEAALHYIAMFFYQVTNLDLCKIGVTEEMYRLEICKQAHKGVTGPVQKPDCSEVSSCQARKLRKELPSGQSCRNLFRKQITKPKIKEFLKQSCVLPLGLFSFSKFEN